MLHFASKAPFGYEKFLAMCEGLIPCGEMELLRRLDINAVDDRASVPEVIKKWRDFEIAVRNEFVKIRAARKKVEPSGHMRRDGYGQTHLYHAALSAYRNPSHLEGEKSIDKERWHFLDDISMGHYFDFDALAIYALKLLILIKWDAVNKADGPALVESSLNP